MNSGMNQTAGKSRNNELVNITNNFSNLEEIQAIQNKKTSKIGILCYLDFLILNIQYFL